MKRIALAALLLLLAHPAGAQWQTPSHSVPLGKGGGVTGFGNAPVIVGGLLQSSTTGADPTFTRTPTLGASGTAGSLAFGNATSGTVTLQPVAGALGAAVVSLPAITDTLVGLTSSQALTTKTYNGLNVTTTTGTLTMTNGKTLAVTNSLTLAGTDATTMTFPGFNATIPGVVSAGTITLSTASIASAACTVAQTAVATNVATTDAIIISFNGDPTAVTGYTPVTTGMLTIIPYPTANTVNVKVCNNTVATITPGAITLNWRVVR